MTGYQFANCDENELEKMLIGLDFDRISLSKIELKHRSADLEPEEEIEVSIQDKVKRYQKEFIEYDGKSWKIYSITQSPNFSNINGVDVEDLILDNFNAKFPQSVEIRTNVVDYNSMIRILREYTAVSNERGKIYKISNCDVKVDESFQSPEIIYFNNRLTLCNGDNLNSEQRKTIGEHFRLTEQFSYTPSEEKIKELLKKDF